MQPPHSLDVPPTPLRVHEFGSDAALPPADGTVFADPRDELLGSREWLRNCERHGIAPGYRIRLFALTSEDDGVIRALLPAVYSRLYSAHTRARVLHFRGAEGRPYMPWPARGPLDIGATIERVVEFVHAGRRGYDVLRFSPLEPSTPVLEAVVRALRRTRHPLQVYRTHRSSFAATAGVAFDAYFSARPQALQERVARAIETLVESGRAGFRMVDGREDIETALRDLARVDEASANGILATLPGYVPGLVHAAAQAGALRLGFLDLDGEPAAAQLWVLSARTAHCLQILCVSRHSDLALDELLTMHLARHLLDVDRVAELDFGAVVEEISSYWATGTRDRVGVIAFNPRTWRGIKGTLRHIVAPRLLAIPRGLWRKFEVQRT